MPNHATYFNFNKNKCNIRILYETDKQSGKAETEIRVFNLNTLFKHCVQIEQKQIWANDIRQRVLQFILPAHEDIPQKLSIPVPVAHL